MFKCHTNRRRSYVAALELRIEKLEKRLAYAKSFKASVTQHDSETNDNIKSEPSTVSSTPTPTLDEGLRRDSLAAIRAAVHRKAAKDREAADVNKIVSDFGFLYVPMISSYSPPCPLNLITAQSTPLSEILILLQQT